MRADPVADRHNFRRRALARRSVTVRRRTVDLGEEAGTGPVGSVIESSWNSSSRVRAMPMPSSCISNLRRSRRGTDAVSGSTRRLRTPSGDPGSRGRSAAARSGRRPAAPRERVFTHALLGREIVPSIRQRRSRVQGNAEDACRVSSRTSASLTPGTRDPVMPRAVVEQGSQPPQRNGTGGSSRCGWISGRWLDRDVVGDSRSVMTRSRSVR